MDLKHSKSEIEPKRKIIMARKITISKDYLVNTAFQMVKQEGIEQVTARKLASKAECSTQPIFRSYENMEELYQELFRMANSFFAFYYERFPKEQKEPFINLAYAYIQFAKEEKHLFRFLFLPNRSYGKSTYEILNGEKGLVVAEFEKAKQDGCKNVGDLFTKLWIFVHGAACMAITGDYDLSDRETVKLLKDTYQAFK